MGISVSQEIYNAAAWAAKQLNVPVKVILGQWALEQGTGFDKPSDYHYNLAGLTPGSKYTGQTWTDKNHRTWRAYSSVDEFARDYVYSFVLNNWPNAYGKQTADEYANALGHGLGGVVYYGDTDPATYAAGIKKAMAGLTLPETVGKTEKEGISWGIPFSLLNALNGLGTAAFGAGAGVAASQTETGKKVAKKVQEAADSVGSMFRQGLYVVAGLVAVVLGFVILTKSEEGGLKLDEISGV